MFCTSSPRPGTTSTSVHYRQPHHVDLVLAHAHRFDQHDLLAGGIQHQRRVGRGAREAAKESPRGHGANEDARIGGVPLHADAVAQHRAAGVRARGIDGDDAHRLPASAVVRRQPINERALARARRPVTPIT